MSIVPLKKAIPIMIMDLASKANEKGEGLSGNSWEYLSAEATPKRSAPREREYFFRES